MTYISAWKIHCANLRSLVAEAAGENRVADNDIVWAGPSGDAVITPTAADLDEEYAEYFDAGQVSEYLD